MRTRIRISLDRDWEFIRRRASRRWINGIATDRDVDLPHCWNDQDAFREGVMYYRGWGSYRRRFRLDGIEPVDSKAVRWRLVAEGFYGTGDVWLNGRRLGRMDGQYLGFEFDVTGSLNVRDENRIGIRLTNRCRSSVLPGTRKPDFILYGGLSGRMWLERVPATRIDLAATRIDCEIRAPASLEAGDENRSGSTDKPSEEGSPACNAMVVIASGVAGPEAGGCRLSWTIRDDQGRSVAESLPADGKGAGRDARIEMTAVRLWDVNDPHLYTAQGTLTQDGVVVDDVSIRFGLRRAEFQPDEGFFLNGRRVPLRGCNRHESMPGFGRALPLWLHREDAVRIKDMGLNFVRLSHYPQHPAFLDACDELGLLVYAEIASWKSVRGGAWLRRACRQMQGMILRDRHHPSIILWGMGNESRHRGAYRRLYALCKKLDPARPVTYAENHLYRARRIGTVGLPDVWGTNYEFEAMAEGRDASRQRCVVVSECSDCPDTQRGRPDAESQQLETLRRDLEIVEKEAFVAGFALWSYNDYATRRRGRYRYHSGILDAWRIPKKSAAWLAERYGNPAVAESLTADQDKASRPVAIILKPERGRLSAEERETLGVYVNVIDEHGRISTWQGKAAVEIEGPVRLRSYTAEADVWVADGIGRLFVTSTGESGRIHLTVSSPGLIAGTAALAAE